MGIERQCYDPSRNEAVEGKGQQRLVEKGHQGLGEDVG